MGGKSPGESFLTTTFGQRRIEASLPCLSPLEAGDRGMGDGARVGIPVRLSPSPAPRRPVLRTRVTPSASGVPSGDGRRPRSLPREGCCRRRASGGLNPCANPVPWRGNYLKPAPASIGHGRARGECNIRPALPGAPSILGGVRQRFGLLGGLHPRNSTRGIFDASRVTPRVGRDGSAPPAIYVDFGRWPPCNGPCNRFGILAHFAAFSGRMPDLNSLEFSSQSIESKCSKCQNGQFQESTGNRTRTCTPCGAWT